MERGKIEFKKRENERGGVNEEGSCERERKREISIKKGTRLEKKTKILIYGYIKLLGC